MKKGTLCSYPPMLKKKPASGEPVAGLFFSSTGELILGEGVNIVNIGVDTMAKIPYKQLSKELKRLKKILGEIPEDRRPIAESLFAGILAGAPCFNGLQQNHSTVQPDPEAAY